MTPKCKANFITRGGKKCKENPQSASPNNSANKNDNNENTVNPISGKNVHENNAAYPGFVKVKMGSDCPKKLFQKATFETKEYPIMELNQLLQKRTKLSFQGSICWKIMQFPSILKMDLTTKNVYQYFGLDLIDVATGRTFWTHKPGVWETLFKSIQQFAKTG